jgi:hypothetical protein
MQLLTLQSKYSVRKLSERYGLYCESLRHIWRFLLILQDKLSNQEYNII